MPCSRSPASGAGSLGRYPESAIRETRRDAPASRLTVLLLAAFLVAPLGAQQVPLDALLRGGRIHFDGQRFDRAREQFIKALTQYGATADNSSLAQIHLWLGLCEAELRKTDSAAGHFVTAMEKDTTLAAKIRQNEQWQYLSWQSLIGATRDSYNAGANEAALTYALAALKVDPSKSQTYALIANIYSALERYEEMRAVANDLLELDPGAPEGLSLLGLYFLQKPDSLWPTKAAKQTRWDSAGAFYDQAIAAYEKRFTDAQAELGKPLRITDPAKSSEVAWRLVEKSRLQDQSELKRYIEKDLGAASQLAEVAQVASRLFYAANNLNSASSRAGSAMLRAATETRGDTSERFRAKAQELFGLAVRYDSSDFTALFDLGITQYQGKQDSLAEASLQKVIDGAVVPLSALPQPWLDSLLVRVTPAVAETGYTQVTGLLAARVDSVLLTQGRKGIGYNWLYFPDLRAAKRTGPASLADTAGMFLSLEPPQLMNQAFLWLGSSQTGLATALADAKRPDAAKASYERAIVNLLVATRLDPQSTDAFQNLGICYRETGQKEKALGAFETADRLRKQGH